MESRLSSRVKRVKPSPTLAVTARAAELRAEGKDIIGLGVGEPDFDTPDHIKSAAKQALDDGFTKYTAVDGIPSLKRAIIDKLKRDNNLDYSPGQVIVSCGGKQCIFNLAQALLDPGDEVIIPAPYWVSYPDIMLLADAEPVILRAGIDQGFKIKPAQIEAAITAKTRLFIINSPSNPTGVCYTREELLALGKVLRQHPQVMIATDDIYEHIVWGDKPNENILTVCPDLYDRVIILNGVSKAYSMTGWRIGYAAGPESLIRGMKKIQSQSTSNPTSISQVAAQTALEGSQAIISDMIGIFKGRHDMVLEALNGMQGVKCLPAQGAFYLFPDVREAIANLDGIDNDVGLAEYLLQEAGVALVPGSAFGAPGYIRLSYATSDENLEKALERLRKVLDK
ncbi:MAG: pyridoxal phosphate-dependent aminotransferase [Gammaproteobacteria bacterium]|nr:pyridoxal phosphate-dependent aminotransferase [Gammaproteobacteria bacterium]